MSLENLIKKMIAVGLARGRVQDFGYSHAKTCRCIFYCILRLCNIHAAFSINFFYGSTVSEANDVLLCYGLLISVCARSFEIIQCYSFLQQFYTHMQPLYF